MTRYLVLSALLFSIGTAGVMMRRSIVVVLMSVELILNAVNINLVAFSRHWGSPKGQVFAAFIIADAVAEAAIGLAVLIALFRHRGTVNTDEVNLLKW